MKALLVSAAAIGLLTTTPAFAQAGPSDPATATADAIIVAPINVENVDGLNFGKIAATAGTVTVNPDGTFASSPDMLVDTAGIGAADFTVSGENGLAYLASLDSGSVTLTRVGGSETMGASLNLSAAPVGGRIVGTDNFSVGGVLTVATGQIPGAYTGSFGVTVQYE